MRRGMPSLTTRARRRCWSAIAALGVSFQEWRILLKAIRSFPSRSMTGELRLCRLCRTFGP